MAGLKEFYCGSNEPSHASQFKWLEYTFKHLIERLYSTSSEYLLLYFPRFFKINIWIPVYKIKLPVKIRETMQY